MFPVATYITVEELIIKAQGRGLSNYDLIDMKRDLEKVLARSKILHGVIELFPESSQQMIEKCYKEKLNVQHKIGPIWTYDQYDDFVAAHYSRIKQSALTEIEEAQVGACTTLYVSPYAIHSNREVCRFAHEIGTMYYGKFANLLNQALCSAIKSEEAHTVLRRIFLECRDGRLGDLILWAFVYNKSCPIDILAMLVEDKIRNPKGLTWDVVGLIRFHRPEKIANIWALLTPSIAAEAYKMLNKSDRESLGLTNKHAENEKNKAS